MSAVIAFEHETPPPRGIVSATPADLLRIAVEQGANIDRLEQLMALQERHEANQARKDFTRAMAAFKAEPLTITKDKHVSFQTSRGVTEYDHATLGNVVRSIIAGLSRHGLSHAWVTERMEGGRIKVTCKVTHANGHSESVALDAAPDDSGGKNAIQAVGSAVSYLQRYTLLAILGLATEDDDGRGAYPENDDNTNTNDADPGDTAAQVARRKADHDAALGRHSESVKFIKERLGADDVKAALAEWALIPPDDQMALWLATSKGGVFSTAERKTIKTGAAS